LRRRGKPSTSAPWSRIAAAENDIQIMNALILHQIPDTRVTEELAYINLANQFLIQQLEQLRAVDLVDGEDRGSGVSGQILLNKTTLLENIKFEDDLMNLLVR
jgi:hypothetical protein